MSRLFPRIPKELSAQLPWPELLRQFGVPTITDLEKACHLPDGTLSRAERGPYGEPGAARGLSARASLSLLKSTATTFSSGAQMRAWMQKHWPAELLQASASALESLYESIDLTNQIPQLGIFPSDYIERPETGELLNLLNERTTRVVWVTGPGGTGKSTLALGLVYRHWAELKTNFKHILYVNAESGDFQDGLRQVAEQLRLDNPGKIERITSRNACLILLDTLHGLDDLPKWRQVTGLLGKLVATSRTRLSDSELHLDHSLRQLKLGGFSLEQSRQFLGRTEPATDRLFEQTGGLPLALRILSGLLDELQCPAAGLVSRLENNAISTLAYPPDVSTRQFNLRQCIDLSYQFLSARHPDAAAYFQFTGLFQTRTILTSLLDDTAGVEDGDQLAAILLRYNLVEPITIRDERFIQLHPLVHEFARELAVETPDHDAALFDWVVIAHRSLANGEHLASVRIHRQDVRHILLKWAREEKWDRLACVLGAAIELLFVENPNTEQALALLNELEQVISQGESLLRVLLLTCQAGLADGFFAPEWDEAWALMETFQPEPGLEDIYWETKVSIITNQVQGLRSRGQFDQALALLQDPKTRQASERSNSKPYSRHLAEILIDQGDHAGALAILQSAQPPSELERGYFQVLQADCYAQLGQLEQATVLYRQTYEERAPIMIRVSYGLDLAASLKAQGRIDELSPLLDDLETLLADEDGEVFRKALAEIQKIRTEIKN